MKVYPAVYHKEKNIKFYFIKPNNEWIFVLVVDNIVNVFYAQNLDQFDENIIIKRYIIIYQRTIISEII